MSGNLHTQLSLLPGELQASKEPLGVCRSTALQGTLTAALTHTKIKVRNSIKAFPSGRVGKLRESVAPADKKGPSTSLAWPGCISPDESRGSLSSLSVGTDNREHYLLNSDSSRRSCSGLPEALSCSPDSCQLLGHASCASAAPTPPSAAVTNVPFPQVCRAQKTEDPDRALSQ